MNGLSELSGALACAIPPQSSEGGIQRPFAFPANLASRISDAPLQLVGGSESAVYQERLWATRLYRKPPRSEGTAAEFLAATHVRWEKGNRQLEAEISGLKTQYVFRNESTITEFILGHRTVVAVLLSALPELKNYFGEDAVFKLEAVSDDADEYISLYAIVVWRGPTECAEAALEEFDERWWLNQSAQPGLTFTYELA